MIEWIQKMHRDRVFYIVYKLENVQTLNDYKF